MTNTATATLHPRTWGTDETTIDVQVPVTYRKREHGMGYYITRTDTGENLGMTRKGTEGWKVWLVGFGVVGEMVGLADTRGEGADFLVSEMVERRDERLEDLVAAARAPFLASRT